MAGITGLGTTYNLPDFTGPLFGLTPTDTPFLSAIGGLTAGEDVPVIGVNAAGEFSWGYYDLRTPQPNRARLEGADAPTPEERVRSSASNVVEIHQEAVSISYTRQAVNPQGGYGDGAQTELDWQCERKVEEVALDVEASFLLGEYQKPSDNSTERKTRGLAAAAYGQSSVLATPITAAATATATTDRITATGHGLSVNDQVAITAKTGAAGITLQKVYFVLAVVDANNVTLSETPGGTVVDITTDGTAITLRKAQALTETMILDEVQSLWDIGGFRNSNTATLIVGSYAKRQLTKAFITDKGYDEDTRSVGGVNLQTIETDFGRLNIMLSRTLASLAPDMIIMASLDQCKPRILVTRDREGNPKGTFFLEPLAKTGASEKYQLYGEIGLEYGNPRAHRVIRGAKIRA